MLPNCLKRRKNVVWQSADGRVTSDHCRVTIQRLFPKCYRIAWNVQKRYSTVDQRSRDLRPLSRDRSVTIFKIFPNCLKRPKNVVWQPADGRVTSNHSRVTVQRLFSKIFLIAWNDGKTLFESQCLVAWLSGYFAFVFFRTASTYAASRIYLSFIIRVATLYCLVSARLEFTQITQLLSYFHMIYNIHHHYFDEVAFLFCRGSNGQRSGCI